MGDSQEGNVLKPVESSDEKGKAVYDKPVKPSNTIATVPSITSAAAGSSRIMQAQFTEQQVGTS